MLGRIQPTKPASIIVFFREKESIIWLIMLNNLN